MARAGFRGHEALALFSALRVPGAARLTGVSQRSG
jgi:hypothetical protein